MAMVLRQPQALNERDQFGFFEDFLWYISPHQWTSLASDASAAAAIDSDGVGGVVTLTLTATNVSIDNDEVAVKTTNELFLAAPSKPIMAEARIQYSEVNTSAVNVCFGLMDVMGSANTLLDDGAGVAASFYGAVIYKVDGETKWRCAASAGTFSSTGTTTTSTTTAGGSSYQTLRIDITPISGAFNSSEVRYFVDGVQLLDSNNRPIKHEIAHGAAATGEMEVGVYAKAGSNTTTTVNVDYIAAYQKR